MTLVTPTAQPVFNLPIRIALGVLSWLAFGVAADLAWESITGSSIAGCGVGSPEGCDAVLNSAWSKWLGMPVAVLGLACYASLAALSVMLWIRSAASRWIDTAFLLMATLAAGASVWFVVLQLFAIGDFCPRCLTTDICGIALGVTALAAAARWWAGTRHTRLTSSSSAGLSALRSAMPAAARLAPVPGTRSASVVTARPAPMASTRTGPAASARTVPLVGSVAKPATLRRNVSQPSFPIAIGGALAMLVVLIGGQIVFPAKPFIVEQVALQESIDLAGGNSSGSDAQASGDGKTRVAMRIPTEGEDVSNSDDSRVSEPDREPSTEQSTNAETTTEAGNGPSSNQDNASSAASATSAKSEPTESKRERKVKFLGGKLTLDVYKHPLIGSPDAPHVVVELVSYDCLHCRKTHRFMKQAMSRYGDQVALIVLVIPLEKSCNKLVTDPAASHDGACTTARMALGVADLEPQSFARFHDFLMSGNKDKPPALDRIITKAYSTVDRTKLRELRDSNELEKQIAGNVNLFDMLRKQNVSNKEFGLPIQILGDHVMSGTIEKSGDLYKAWEEHLGVKPR
ncbi:MAG: thioredoxin domain-containing protein [Planctomycetes bacterium]|nr:thioredoxin domain-containing protein [Planctomycetota bacterium]